MSITECILPLCVALGSGETKIMLIPDAEPCALVVVENGMTTGLKDLNVTTDIGDTRVVIYHGPDKKPDLVVVVPPKGSMAIPPEALVEEGDTVEIMVCEGLIG